MTGRDPVLELPSATDPDGPDTEAGGPPADPGAIRSPWLRPERTMPLAVLIVFGAAGLWRLFSTWQAPGDYAVAELIVRHFDRHVPLSGPYSAQRGYNHPLPLIYILLWPAYVLSGWRSSAALATSVWFNGALAAVATWLLGRRRAAGLAVLAVATLPLLAGRQDRGLIVLPWNPNVAIVSTLALVFVCWLVARGEARLLPLAAALAVWSAGAHLGYLPVAGALGLVAVIGLVVIRLRRDGRAALPKLLAPAAVAVGIAVLMCSPAIIDYAAHGSDSNPAKVAERPNPSGHVVPADQAVKVLRAELSIPPAWAVARQPFDRFLIVQKPRTPGLAVLALAALALAAGRRAWDEVLGIGVALVGVLAACLELIHLADLSLQPWYLHPAHACSMALSAFVVWSLARSARHHLPVLRRPRPVVAAVAAPLACALFAALVIPSLSPPRHHWEISHVTGTLVDDIEAHIPVGTRLEVTGPIRFDGFYSEGLVLKLDKGGYDVRVPEDDRWLYTEAMTKRPAGWNDGARRLLFVLTREEPTPPTPGATLIGVTRVEAPIIPQMNYASVWDVSP